MQFPSRSHCVASLYDACKLIVECQQETNIFSVYEEHNLEDHINFAATAREIMGLISEGSIK